MLDLTPMDLSLRVILSHSLHGSGGDLSGRRETAAVRGRESRVRGAMGRCYGKHTGIATSSANQRPCWRYLTNERPGCDRHQAVACETCVHWQQRSERAELQRGRPGSRHQPQLEMEHRVICVSEWCLDTSDLEWIVRLGGGTLLEK